MKVSIIIPVYNVEKYLPRCIESVINQTYTNIEIILINDCGKDDSWAIAQNYAQRECRIKLIDSAYNHGPMVARSSGVAASSGDFLMFVDSDDQLPKNAVELLIRKSQETEAELVIGDYIYVYGKGKEELCEQRIPYGEEPEHVLRALLDSKIGHSLCAKLYKKELLQNYQYKAYENMTHAEDACWFYQVVSNAKRTVCINKPVYYYMENPSSSTHLKMPLSQIRSIARANKMRLQVCACYPMLQPSADHFVTNVFAGLHCLGFRRREILKILEEEGLVEYYTLSHIFHTLSLRDHYRIFKNTIASYIR